MTFKNSFVNFSLCSPSRSSFFTGQAEIDNKVKDLRYASDAAVGDAARPPRQAQILRG
jgi:arylsulfatase A-like enzyme